MQLMFWNEGFGRSDKYSDSSHKYAKFSISAGMPNILKKIVNHYVLAADKKLNGLLNTADLN